MTEETIETESVSSLEDTETIQRKKLITVLQSLESHIQHQNSLKYAFARGAVYGIGTVVGATLLIALFGGMFKAAITSLQDTPIGGYIDTETPMESLQR